MKRFPCMSVLILMTGNPLFPGRTIACQERTPGLSVPESREQASGKEPADGFAGKLTSTAPSVDTRMPMVSRQKFRLGIRRTLAPVTLAGTAFKAGVYQWLDPDSEYGSGAPGYANRVAVSLADGASSKMFSTFVFPSLLHQDPRYFRKGAGSLWSRVGYSLSRVARTRTDAGGATVNWSRILGSMGSGALSNSYYPVEDRGLVLTFVNAGWTTLTEAGVNLYREFWPDIARRRSRKP